MKGRVTMALPFYWIPAVNYAEVSGKVTDGSDVDVGLDGVRVSAQTLQIYKTLNYSDTG